MVRLTLLAILSVSAAAACPSIAPAGDLVDEMQIGFWRNMCWPKPFVYPDRKAAFAPMHVMAENGWRRNNLLGAHHFAPGGAELTTAGELRVRWILTQAPVHRRNVFVERALDPEETGRRIETVQQFATHVVPDTAASVYDTHILPEGRPAPDVDWTNTQFRENALKPVLPESSSGTSVID